MFGRFYDAVSGRDVGDGEGVMLEFPGVRYSDGARFEDALDDSVMIQSVCKVSGFDGMVVPGASANWFEMHQYFGTNRGHCGCAERVHALHRLER